MLKCWESERDSNEVPARPEEGCKCFLQSSPLWEHVHSGNTYALASAWFLRTKRQNNGPSSEEPAEEVALPHTSRTERLTESNKDWTRLELKSLKERARPSAPGSLWGQWDSSNKGFCTPMLAFLGRELQRQDQGWTYHALRGWDEGLLWFLGMMKGRNSLYPKPLSSRPCGAVKSML